MAIYVYVTTTGVLASYISQNVTVVQAQTSGQLASSSVLAANGLSAVGGLAPIDTTHAWDPGTKTVIIVAALLSTPSLLSFWQRFTSTERESIENLYQTGTQAQKNAVGAFYRYVQAAGVVDCNDTYVQAKVQQLETIGVIATGRAAQILV